MAEPTATLKSVPRNGIPRTTGTGHGDGGAERIRWVLEGVSGLAEILVRNALQRITATARRVDRP